MAIDIERDEKLRRARAQLRELNVDIKPGMLDGHEVVIAVERTAGSSLPLDDIPPLRYPSPDLAAWVGDIAARVTRS